MLTVNTALLPSVIVGLLMVTIGNGVASMITPVAVADVVAVLVDTSVPVKVNVSVPSLILSPVVGTFTVKVVAPAGIVI